jgi:glucose-6-phosphate isomerase
MLEAAAAFKAAGLDYPSTFVAVTGAGSKLDQTAHQGRLARPFPDVGLGRRPHLRACASACCPPRCRASTSTNLLAGAAAMDESPAKPVTARTPPRCSRSCGISPPTAAARKDMVVLPYKDRLLLFSRYLQQLVMESLGKELDLQGRVVNQGIAVYGNKGSTDQHAYVQQLREGVNNFFVTFIEVLKDRPPQPRWKSIPASPAGDYLQGFYLGTRDALSEKNRSSVTITINDVSPRTLGMLIALYERVVGSTPRSSASTPITSPGSKPARRPPPV